MTGGALPRLRTTAERWLDGTGDVRAIALLRIAAGPIVLIHLRPFLEIAADGGSWDDTFHVPYAAWYPALSGGAWRALLWGAVAAAVLMSIGLFTRAATAYTAGFVAWNLFLSQTHFHHNRAFLVILLTGLAVLPVGRVLSIDAVIARSRGRPLAGAIGPLWPLIPMRFSVATAYWASGLSKLLDPDWWGGVVLQLRIEQYGSSALDRGAPEWVIDLLASEAFMWWFAKVVVLTEVFIGVGLLVRRTRLAAVWVAIPFHLTIEATAEVQVFSLAGLCALVIWVTPTTRDRTLVVSGAGWARRLGAAVRWLDWTGRFTVEQSDAGTAVTLYDRPGGTGAPIVRTGREAVWFVLSRLPLAFPIAAPVLPIRSRRGRRARRRNSRSTAG